MITRIEHYGQDRIQTGEDEDGNPIIEEVLFQTDPAPIAATFEIGSRNGGNQFAGNFPMFATLSLPPMATLAEYQAYILTSKNWNYIGVSA